MAKILLNSICICHFLVEVLSEEQMAAEFLKNSSPNSVSKGARFAIHIFLVIGSVFPCFVAKIIELIHLKKLGSCI